MTEPKDDGGPAFPGGHGDDFIPGMPLRDYIAAGVVAQMAPRIMFPQAEVRAEDFEAYAPHVAYGFADAMLKERKP